MHSNYRQVIARKRRRQIFKRIVGVLCCIVVFCTTYALILPAITMENKALCGIEEHTHTEDCYEKGSGQIQICGQNEQEGHAHGESCYVPRETESPSVHSHKDDCYCQGALICETEADHIHAEECFTEQIICEAEDEAHVHDDACAERVLDCAVEEHHSHGVSCYEWTISCGMEEGQQEEAEPAEPVLVCTEPVVAAHTHDDTCFGEVQSGFVTVCGNTDEDHSHSSECYKLECVLPEHEHTMICFSDPEADMETPGVWEATFADVALTGNSAENLVAIAQSQIGYTESSRNYDVLDDNTLCGYTRYGAWFGDPYGEWDAMFVSFCLRYAGVEGMPKGDSVSSLQSDLVSAGLYCSAKETKAQKGNLIFLDTDADGVSDRVGIVAQVQEAQEHTGDSVKTIEGDVSGSVRYQYYAPDASQILGYGLLPGQERIPVTADPVTEEEKTVSYVCGISDHAHGEDCYDAEGSLICSLEEHIHDDTCIKDPSMVYIESVSESVVVTYSAIRVPEVAQTSGRSTFRMYSAPMPVLDEDTGEENTGIRDLYDYIVTEYGGSLSLKIFTSENKEPTKNENGEYVIKKGEEYQLSLGFSLKGHGMEQGIYEYQFPEYFVYSVQSGKLYDSESGNVELGQWTLDTSGRMEFEFYEISNNYQSVTMTVSVDTTVKENIERFDFDGTIYVVVEPEEDDDTQMSVIKLSEAVEGTDQIRWTVSVIPGTADILLGMVVTDTLDSDQHYFSENDKNQGITIGFNSGGDWHQITVQPTWIGDSGFEFVIPEKTCEFCHNTFTYTPGTQYYIVYTTTVREDLADGYYIHKNNVMVGDKSAPGSYGHYIGIPKSNVVKTGRLDPATQDFKWTVQATIPAYSGGKSVYWQLVDWARIVDVNVPEWALKENFRLTQDSFESVMAYYNGTSVTVPHVSQVTPQDPFCYYFFYDENSGQNFLYLAAPCTCTAETCATLYPLEEWCDSYIWDQNNRETVFCKCWTVPYDVVVTYNMAFDGERLIKTYGGQDLTFVNSVGLSSFYMNSNKEYISTGEVTDYGMIEVPGMMKKALVEKAEFENGYVASFAITVNESKMDLSQLGTQGGSSNVSIVDTMSEFLYYVPGSMVITREDQDNQKTVMQYGTDYTMTYTMTANDHILTVELLSPGPYEYELDYDARVIAQDNAYPSYKNYAEVSLAATTYGGAVGETFITNYSYTASSYSVTLHKTCSNSGQALSGATFGLYAENGELLAQDVTDDTGDIIFTTDLEKNIVYQLHEPYYLQEISAPEGYMLDKTKHWFYICNVEDGTCTECANVPDHEGMIKAPKQTVQAQNTFGGPILPNTGGTGKELYTMGGMLLMMVAAVLLYNQKKCRKEDYESF